MQSITFIHAADLHLDSTFQNLEQGLPNTFITRAKESSFVSLGRIVDKAILEQVDFVLFAGDIYDNKERSIRAQVKFYQEMERLNKVGIQVYLVHGNHDFLQGTDSHMDVPSNVHIFGESVEAKPYEKNGNLLAYIYGFSYKEQTVRENMTSYYQKQAGATYHIGMLHGSVMNTKEHDTYAPFSIDELVDKHFDYWALGHIHKRQILHESPPIVYPGNIQGRHRKELGEKGFYLVELSPFQVTCDFYGTQDIIWKEMNLPVTDDLAELRQLFLDTLEEVREENHGVFLSLIVTGTGTLEIEELLEVLLEGEEERPDFAWVVNVRDKRTVDKEIPAGSFLEEVLTESKKYNEMETLLSPFTDGAFVRKVDLQFTEEDMAEIKKMGEALILQLFEEVGE